MCHNPSCGVLQLPLEYCKKRACAQYRKDNNIRRPLKPKQKRQVTSTKQYSDTSEDEQSSGDITPRKKLPRKSSARSVPVKSPVSDSDSSSRDDDDDMSQQSSPAVSVKSPAVKLTRSGTQTLDGEFVVSKVLAGPGKKDKKYLVSWEEYGSEDNTWEPRANLPDECFNSSSDESGDNEPLHTQVIRKRVVPEPEIAEIAPLVAATSTTATPPILEPFATTLPVHKRTNRFQSVCASPPDFGGRKSGLQTNPRDLLDPTLVNKGRMRQKK